jgi:hypothetical protein
MPTFRVTGGALTLDSVGGNYPDNSLPGDQPGIDNSLPIPPPPLGVWPPPVPAHPIVPAPPGTPPGSIWPPVGGYLPPKPDQGLPPGSGSAPGTPTHPIAPPPGGQVPGTPEHPIAGGTYWCLVYMPNYGWSYHAIDPSLRPGMPLPPHAQPK